MLAPRAALRPIARLVALTLLLAAEAAHASEPAVNEATVGVTRFDYTEFFRSTAEYYALDLAYHRSLGWTERRSLRVGGGLRLSGGAAVGLPVEIYVRAQLQASLGPWRPAVGPEVGYSGFRKLTSDREYRPPDIFNAEQDLVGPIYGGLTAAPLRFFLWDFVVSALELQVGTTFSPPGASRRLQIGLLSIGAAL